MDSIHEKDLLYIQCCFPDIFAVTLSSCRTLMVEWNFKFLNGLRLVVTLHFSVLRLRKIIEISGTFCDFSQEFQVLQLFYYLLQEYWFISQIKTSLSPDCVSKLLHSKYHWCYVTWWIYPKYLSDYTKSFKVLSWKSFSFSEKIPFSFHSSCTIQCFLAIGIDCYKHIRAIRMTHWSTNLKPLNLKLIWRFNNCI